MKKKYWIVVIVLVPIILILLSLPISRYINNHLGSKPITSSSGCKSGLAPGKLVLNSKNKLNYLNMTSILEQYDLEYMTFRRNDEISFSITVPVGEEDDYLQKIQAQLIEAGVSLGDFRLHQDTTMCLVD